MQYINFFHSKKLMQTYERVPLHKPYMVVAFEGDKPIAHMLVAKRNGKCRIFGEGEYHFYEDKKSDQNVNSEAQTSKSEEDVFGEMLAAFTKTQHFPTLYIEVSDLSRKMFAYKHFRRNKFFPIHWLEVHNSLHSKSPIERATKRTIRKVAYARKMGVTTSLVTTKEDFDRFYTVTRRYYNFHLRKFCPQKSFFQNLMNTDEGKLFITTYRGKVIATCVLACTQGDAWLWFGAYQTKSHPRLNPDLITIWNAMNYAYVNGIQHFRFMDVGLPFFKNTYLDLILNFGGKSVGTNRWFHFFPNILQRIIRIFFK